MEEQPSWKVIAQASDGREAIRQTLAAAPDVAVLDIAMPLLNGIEATRQIIRRAPSVHVLILSMHAEEAYITQSVQAGAKGYLLKIPPIPIWCEVSRRSRPASRLSARRQPE